MKDYQYDSAKEIFEEYEVDVERAFSIMDTIPLSIHCWQLDAFRGFEDPDGELTGGIAVTGKAADVPHTKDEFFWQLSKVLKMIPGNKKIATHAIYLVSEAKVERNELCPSHFSAWVDFANINHIGLDFNPTYFSHEKSKSGFTLASPDESIRNYWIEHGKCCRRIGEYFGRETGIRCITNHWIPDGYKDTCADTLEPRLRLIDSMNKIFEPKLNKEYNIDSVESKLFGLGVESYTVGSHEFYMNYCNTTKKAILCLDVGHFHPTESVASKISAYLAFDQELMLHVSRGVRWDSDHVVIMDQETMAIMEEIVRGNALGKVNIGTDYFDGSISGFWATVIGSRAAKQAMLRALLMPNEMLKEVEANGNLTKRLALQEAVKTLPYGIVWNLYCEMHNCLGDKELVEIM